MAGMAAAAQLLHGQQSGRRLRYCMVGLGRISMQHFMPACRASQFSRVTALVSGHRDKADRMAAEYGIPAKNIYSYENYNAIADNPEIDAVYIALPNSMHAEYTIRAARAGKHVLCEKPMATKVADAQAMVDACRKAGRKLMVAYRCQLEPATVRAMQLIRQGKLGTIESIESSNGFNIKAGEWRLDGVLGGGGPLMDVGIYSLNACRFLTGEEPAEFKAQSSVIDRDGRFTQVEENLAWTMKFPAGRLAACNTSYGASLPGFFRVHGSKGMLHMDAAFGYQGQHLTGKVQGEPDIDFATGAKDPAHFVDEADHFSQCVFQNKEPVAPGEEGLRDMRHMDAIYKSCGLKGL
jgi:predicted dehydrogenase